MATIKELRLEIKRNTGCANAKELKAEFPEYRLLDMRRKVNVAQVAEETRKPAELVDLSQYRFDKAIDQDDFETACDSALADIAIARDNLQESRKVIKAKFDKVLRREVSND